MRYRKKTGNSPFPAIPMHSKPSSNLALIPALCFAGCILLACLASTLGAAQAQPGPQALPSAPNPAPSVSPFAEARHLAEQGNYDAALAKLQDLAAREPSLKGLSAEIGTTYYKK